MASGDTAEVILEPTDDVAKGGAIDITTDRLIKRMSRNPLVSVVIGSFIVGIGAWATTTYFGLVIDQQKQPLIDKRQNERITHNEAATVELETNIAADVEELRVSLKALETAHTEQRILLVQIHAAVEAIK